MIPILLLIGLAAGIIAAFTHLWPVAVGGSVLVAIGWPIALILDGAMTTGDPDFAMGLLGSGMLAVANYLIGFGVGFGLGALVARISHKGT